MRLDANAVMLTIASRISVDAIPITQKPAPISTPTAAVTQIPAAVVNPDTRSPGAEDCSSPEEADPGDDRCGDTNSITSPVDQGCVAEYQNRGCDEEGRPGSDQHVGANAGRLVQNLSIEADEATGKRRHDGSPDEFPFGGHSPPEALPHRRPTRPRSWSGKAQHTGPSLVPRADDAK